MAKSLKMKTYRLAYRYRDNAQCAFLSLDKSAIGAKEAELNADGDYTTFGISEEDNYGLLYPDETLDTPFLSFIKGDAIFIGERHRDSRCTGTRKFYTMPEHEKEARIKFDKERRGQETTANSYYAQPWV